MRKRYQEFAESIVEQLAENPEQHLDDLALNAGNAIGLGGARELSDKHVIKRAKHLLKNPDIVAAIGEFYEQAAGFTVEDGAKMLVKWIKGEVEGQPPSLPALQMFIKMTTPQATKQVRIDQRSIVARVQIGDEPPKLVTRTIEE